MRTKADVLAKGRKASERRIRALLSARERIEVRPTAEEIKDSERRWYDLNHDLEVINEDKTDQH